MHSEGPSTYQQCQGFDTRMLVSIRHHLKKDKFCNFDGLLDALHNQDKVPSRLSLSSSISTSHSSTLPSSPPFSFLTLPPPPPPFSFLSSFFSSSLFSSCPPSPYRMAVVVSVLTKSERSSSSSMSPSLLTCSSYFSHGVWWRVRREGVRV